MPNTNACIYVMGSHNARFPFPLAIELLFQNQFPELFL